MEEQSKRCSFHCCGSVSGHDFGQAGCDGRFAASLKWAGTQIPSAYQGSEEAALRGRWETSEANPHPAKNRPPLIFNWKPDVTAVIARAVAHAFKNGRTFQGPCL